MLRPPRCSLSPECNAGITGASRCGSRSTHPRHICEVSGTRGFVLRVDDGKIRSPPRAILQSKRRTYAPISTGLSASGHNDSIQTTSSHISLCYVQLPRVILPRPYLLVNSFEGEDLLTGPGRESMNAEEENTLMRRTFFSIMLITGAIVGLSGCTPASFTRSGANTPTRPPSSLMVRTVTSLGQVTYNGHPLYYFAGDAMPDGTWSRRQETRSSRLAADFSTPVRTKLYNAGILVLPSPNNGSLVAAVVGGLATWLLWSTERHQPHFG